MSARRRRRRALVVAFAALFFGACSPADQSAVTMDRDSGAPQLVLALCPGETVSAAQVAVAAVDADGYAVDGEVLWRVVAERPLRVQRITAGVTPEGFIEVTSRTDFTSQERLVMTAEVDGGLASSHGVDFDPDTLEVGELQQYDQRTSRDDLVRAAKANCSDNPLDALALSPSALVVLGSMFIAACVTAGLVPWALMRRSERRREALIPPP